MWLNTSGCHPNSALKMKTIKRIENKSICSGSKYRIEHWLTNKGGHRLLMFWFIPPSDGSCEHSWHCRFEPVQCNVQYSVQYSVQDWGGLFSQSSQQRHIATLHLTWSQDWLWIAFDSNISRLLSSFCDKIWWMERVAMFLRVHFWGGTINRSTHSHNLSAARGPVSGNHKGIQKV